ncbi:MAG TPA: DUF1214 domain-containing protein [Acidimicrobiia bacterium]
MPDDPGAPTGHDRLVSGAAWTELCDRLAAVGRRITEPDFPGTPRDRAEGFRYLARLAVFALQWSIEFSDPRFPAFYRYDDDVVKWGGPNADNQYLRAKVEPAGTYRVTGNVTGLRDLIISTPEGDMQLGQYRVFEERNLEQLEIGRDGTLEVVVSAEQHPGNWIPLHPEADHVLVRQYVSDWDHDAVATLRVERVDTVGAAPPPLEPEFMTAALDRAAMWVERSAVYWNEYLRQARERMGRNALAPPMTPPGGARDILYGGGWWELADGEALVVDCEAPEARYWSIQLYNPGWFESLDIANRTVSLSGDQIHVDGDGRFRVVIAHDDPGVPNWLDTEHRREGLVSYRWVFSATAPAPASRVVPVADVRAHLPADTPAWTGDQRRDQIARRQAAVARRFRT